MTRFADPAPSPAARPAAVPVFARPPRCESCGYELGATLDSGGPAAPCPECGTPAWRSSPALRPGSPWQQKPGVGSFFSTLWLTVAKPFTVFRAADVSGRRARSLLIAQCSLASLAFLSPWSGVFVADPVRQLRFARSFTRIAQILGAVGAELLLLTCFLLAATWAMAWTLRGYARARGWNADAATMRTIVAHASIGWTVVAGVVWSMLTAWFIATLIVSSSGSPAAARVLGDASGWLSTAGSRYGLLPLPVLVFGCGGVLVAKMTMNGLSACRFANAPATLGAFNGGSEQALPSPPSPAAA